jgi:hypothetical protein
MSPTLVLVNVTLALAVEPDVRANPDVRHNAAKAARGAARVIFIESMGPASSAK